MKQQINQFTIDTFDELRSTNDYVKEYAQQLAHLTVIVAKKQTQGRGRFVREWKSQVGDVMMTICWKDSKFPHWLLAPLAIVEALKQLTVDAKIKWPNDILVKDKKICGILIESIYLGNDWLGDAIGIGLNIIPNSEGSSLQEIMATDSNIDRQISSSKLIELILEEYGKLTKYFQNNDATEIPEELMSRYRSFSYVLGKSITHESNTYVVKDIAENGSLILIDHKGKEHQICSQEITLHELYGKER